MVTAIVVSQAKYIGMGALPTIIGGADLVRFAEEMSTLTQEWQYEREVPHPHTGVCTITVLCVLA